MDTYSRFVTFASAAVTAPTPIPTPETVAVDSSSVSRANALSGAVQPGLLDRVRDAFAPSKLAHLPWGFVTLLTVAVVGLVALRWSQRKRSTRSDMVFTLQRTGALPDPRSMTDRAQAFAAELPDDGRPATLLVHRDQVSLTSWLALPMSGKPETAANTLANAVAARYEIAKQLPELTDKGGSYIAEMRVLLRDPYAGRDVQIGDPAELARTFARVMSPESWAALVVRKPRRREVERIRRWYAHYLGGNPNGAASSQHFAYQSNPLVATLYVGSSSAAEARSITNQMAAVMPGFDLNVTEVAPTITTATNIAAGLTAVLFGLAWQVLHLPIWAAGAIASVAAIPALGFAFELIPTRAARTRHAASIREFPSPKSVRRFAKAPEAAKVQNTPNGQKNTPAKAGEYPLHATSVFIAAPLAATFIAPHSGGASGATRTGEREVSAALREVNGPFIGTAGEPAVPVFLSQNARRIAVVGTPGAGKSALVRLIWAYDLLERKRPSGVHGSVGSNSALVALETKGEGADHYAEWCERLGIPYTRIDLADGTMPSIDLFAGLDRPRKRAELFVEAMKAAFGEATIGNTAKPSLVATVAAGLVVTPDMATLAGVRHGSPLWYAFLLLGGQGDDPGKSLAGVIDKHSFEIASAQRSTANLPAVPGDTSVAGYTPAAVDGLVEAAEILRQFYADGVTPSNRRNSFGTSVTKIGQLLAAEGWFGASRPKLSWDDILDQNMVVIVNTGTSLGASADEMHGEDLAELMAAMLLFTLKESIRRKCAGWGSNGRAVSIFADELKDVAGASPDVVTWMREQGRSYGIWLTFATQRPEQLDQQVRSSFKNFDTVVWMKMHDPAVAKEAADDLSLGGDTWTPADVANLPLFTGLVRATINGERQPPVPVRISGLEFDGTIEEFISANPVRRTI